MNQAQEDAQREARHDGTLSGDYDIGGSRRDWLDSLDSPGSLDG